MGDFGGRDVKEYKYNLKLANGMPSQQMIKRRLHGRVPVASLHPGQAALIFFTIHSEGEKKETHNSADSASHNP